MVQLSVAFPASFFRPFLAGPCFFFNSHFLFWSDSANLLFTILGYSNLKPCDGGASGGSIGSNDYIYYVYQSQIPWLLICSLEVGESCRSGNGSTSLEAPHSANLLLEHQLPKRHSRFKYIESQCSPVLMNPCSRTMAYTLFFLYNQ